MYTLYYCDLSFQCRVYQKGNPTLLCYRAFGIEFIFISSLSIKIRSSTFKWYLSSIIVNKNGQVRLSLQFKSHFPISMHKIWSEFSNICPRSLQSANFHWISLWNWASWIMYLKFNQNMHDMSFALNFQSWKNVAAFLNRIWPFLIAMIQKGMICHLKIRSLLIRKIKSITQHLKLDYFFYTSCTISSFILRFDYFDVIVFVVIRY